MRSSKHGIDFTNAEARIIVRKISAMSQYLHVLLEMIDEFSHSLFLLDGTLELTSKQVERCMEFFVELWLARSDMGDVVGKLDLSAFKPEIFFALFHQYGKSKEAIVLEIERRIEKLEKTRAYFLNTFCCGNSFRRAPSRRSL